jgi:hypothetical protein
MTSVLSCILVNFNMTNPISQLITFVSVFVHNSIMIRLIVSRMKAFILTLYIVFLITRQYYVDTNDEVLRSSNIFTINRDSNYLTQNRSTTVCGCVHCCDYRCGHIWRASAIHRHGDFFLSVDHIQIIISHCMSDLYWIEDFFRGYLNSRSQIYIYSKCGKDVNGAPEGAKVFRMKNIGRNDHTYLYHILRHAHSHSDGKSNVVLFFFKDNRVTADLLGAKWRSFQELIHITSKNNFACALEMNVRGNYEIRFRVRKEYFYLSAYHNKRLLDKFSMTSYRSITGLYDNLTFEKGLIATQFKSNFSNLGSWQNAMSIVPASAIVQVCFGGSFVTTMKAIQKQPQRIWESLELSLSRADNVEEGHFMERTWAGLLSNPLSQEEVSAIKKYTSRILRNSYINGALMHKIESDRKGALGKTHWESCMLTE